MLVKIPTNFQDTEKVQEAVEYAHSILNRASIPDPTKNHGVKMLDLHLLDSTEVEFILGIAGVARGWFDRIAAQNGYEPPKDAAVLKLQHGLGTLIPRFDEAVRAVRTLRESAALQAAHSDLKRCPNCGVILK